MVSLFPHIKATTGGQHLALADVLAGIAAGQWAAEVEAVRAHEAGSPAYDAAKRALPYFTPSGTFERRAVGGLVEHSGFMSLDLDAKPNPDTDWAAVRAAIEADEHTYAVFVSTGGVGLCVIVPVPTTHHLASFRALEAYYATHFGVRIDQSCKDVSRARFVSYDPALTINEAAETFAEILDEPRPKAAPPRAPLAEPVVLGPSAEVEERLLAVGVKMIREAQDGGKYVQVRNAGHLLGGYVGAGFVDAGRAFDALYSALLAKENVTNAKVAEAALRSGLEVSGPARPLLPDWLQMQVRKELRANGQSLGSIVEQATRIAATCHVPLEGVQDAVRHIAEEQKHSPDLLTFWHLVDGGKRDAPPKLQLSLDKFIDWLSTEGFRKYRSTAGGYATVRVVESIVSEVDRGQLMDHVLGYLSNLPFEVDGVYTFQLRELVLAQERKLFDSNFLQALPTLDDSWLRDGPAVGYFFFRNCWVAVSADAISPQDYHCLPGMIWAEQVRPHDFRDIGQPAALQCDFHQFTRNVAGGSAERLELLRAALGYLLHGYKEEQNAKCVIFVDEVATTGKPDGRTGKSLLIKAVGELVQVTTIAGATFRFEDSFRFQRISAATRLAYFDEWDGRRLPFKKLFTEITSEIAVNRKNHAEFTIPFSDSPKFAITTNDVVSGEGGSHEGRKIEIPLAPHYSSKHTPKDDFGVGFFKEGWDVAEYNRFFNLALGWVQQFLAGGRQLTQLASAALDARKLEDSTSTEFLEFVRTELAELEKRGHTIWAEQAYKDFMAYAGENDRRFPLRRFYHWMGKVGYQRKRWKGIGADRDKSYFELPDATAPE